MSNARTARVHVARGLIVGFATIILAACSSGEREPPSDWQIVKDSSFYYSLALPADCTVIRATDDTSQRRVDAKCIDTLLITLFAVKLRGVADVNKAAERADEQWSTGFQLEEKHYKPETPSVLRWLEDDIAEYGITKVYTKGDRTRVITTETNGQYIYYLLMDGGPDAKATFVNVAASLKRTVDVRNVGQSLLYYFSAIVLACLLGFCGYSIRKSRNMLMALRGLKGKPNIDGGKLVQAMRSERRKIGLYFLGAAAIYGGGLLFSDYLFNPMIYLLFLFGGPVLPILGYFGVVFEPDV